jgi:pimeloyl-ACP methyl ester carboxylesterase
VAERAVLARARWVFLRGVARESAHWGSFVDTWGAALPSTQVVCPDLAGCGQAAAVDCPATVPGLLEGIRAQLGLTSLRVVDARPLAVFALSLGGMLALEWLARYPGELAGAVLVNTSVGGLSPPWRRLRPRGLWHLARAAAARSAPAREAQVYAMVSARPALAGPVVASWIEVGEERPIASRTARRHLLAAARYRRRVLRAPAPVLVLASAGDRMVAPSCSRAIAGALGAELREHPTAGHDLPLDEPAWTAGEIAAWIGRAVPDQVPQQQDESEHT